MTDIHGGAQQDRIVGGSQQVSEKLAQSGLPAGSILYNKPVRRIVQERTHVRVYSDSDVYVARFVVVAMPPALAGRIISLFYPLLLLISMTSRKTISHQCHQLEMSLLRDSQWEL